MYGRFSSSRALLMSAAVIGISAACGMCILCIQNLTHLATAFIQLPSFCITIHIKVQQNIVSAQCNVTASLKQANLES